MTDFFFKNNKCGVANKVPKSDFKFVLDCDITPTPAPIFDCPLPIVPREPEFPCPKFDVTSKLQVGLVGDINNCDVNDNKIKFTIEKKKKPDDCPPALDCEYDVSLEIDVAIPTPPCPDIRVGVFSVKSGYADQPCVDDDSRFEIRKRRIPGAKCDDPGACEFEVDLEVVVPIPRQPCPEIKIKTFSVVSDYANNCPAGQNRFEITTTHRPPASCDDPGECKFDVELEIYVPLPEPPCPEIKVRTFAVSALYPVAPPLCDAPEVCNRFEITRVFEPAPCGDQNIPPKCDFEVDLAICIPPPLIPCPEIKVKTFTVQSDYADSCFPGQSKFEITTRHTPATCTEPPRCEFDVSLEIFVPIPRTPCPEIKVKTFAVSTLYPIAPALCAAPEGCNRFDIRRIFKQAPCGDPSQLPQCDFEVELEICIPPPAIPCPVIAVKTFKVISDYANKCAGGQNKFEITTRHTPATCDEPATCEFDIDVEIYVPIPEPPCPEIKVRTFAVSALYPVAPPLCDAPEACNRFEITRVFEPAPCGDPGIPPRCDFTVDLAICIPPPLIPCPVINVKTFKVKSDYATTCTPGQNKFEITPRHTPATCTEPPRCEFDVSLEIFVPIPAPPCPEIKVGTFTVASGYEDRVCGDPKNRFEIRKTFTPAPCGDPSKSPTCEFEVDIEIFIPIPRPPCPKINVTTFTVKSDYADNCQTGQNRFEISPTYTPPTCDEPSECRFDVALEIFVPIPRPPCPEITVNTFKIKSGYADQPCVAPANRFEIRRVFEPAPCGDLNIAPTCEFEIDFEAYIQIPRPPCPVIAVKTFKVISDYAKNCAPGQNRFEITTLHRAPTSCTDSGECRFDIDVEIYVPIPEPPCPEIKVRTFAVSALYPTAPVLCGDSNCNRFEITRLFEPAPCGDPTAPPRCEFEVDLAICIPPPLIPCPIINVKTFKVKSGYVSPNCEPGSNKFEITPSYTQPTCDSPPVCEFDIELEIFIPIPQPPCPAITVTSFTVSPLYPVAQIPCADTTDCNKFEIRRSFTPAPCGDLSQPPQCEFEVDLAICLPPPLIPCPEIKVKTFKVISGYSGSPCVVGADSQLKITKRETPGTCETPPKCEFDVELEIVVPIPETPCPSFTVTTFAVTSDYKDCLPSSSVSTFKITPKPVLPQSCTDGGECNFDVELEIFVPIPRPPCPKIEVKVFEVIPQYKVACVPPFKTGCGTPNKFEITKREKPAPCAGTADNEEETLCEFDVNLQISIPPPFIPCPELNIKTFGVKTEYVSPTCPAPSSSTFKVTKKTTPCIPCDEPEKCEFDFELEIVVPIPQPRCPEINVKTFNVKTGYANTPCAQGSNKFTITKTTSPPPNPCDPQSAQLDCKFDVELEIVVPIPEPPCPDITIKTFKVKADYQKCLTGNNAFRVTKKVTPAPADCAFLDPPKCEFEFELELEVPIPEPPCPDIKVASFGVNYISYNPLTQPPPVLPGCNFLKITKLTGTTDCLGGGSVGPSGPTGPTGATGPTGPTTPGECEFNIDLQICIPVPQIPEIPCPKFNTKLKVDAKYEGCTSGNNVFEITKNASNTDECEFDVNLEISIPIPKPPCPEFNTSLVLNTFLSQCGVPGGIFEVTKDIIPGTCDGEPERCLYDFLLALNIPIPKFVEDVVFNPINPVIKVNWCAVGGAAPASKVEFKFLRRADIWANDCNRGQRVEFDTKLNIDLVLPRPSCDFFLLKPKQAQFPVKRVVNKDEFFKLNIVPKPGLGCNPCEFEFDIDLQLRCVPCPVFHKKEFKIEFLQYRTEPPRGDIKIKPRPKEDCEFPCEYDITVELHIPKPCEPEFSVALIDINPCYYSDYAEFLTCTAKPNEFINVEIYQAADSADCDYEIYIFGRPPIYKPVLVCDKFITSLSRFKVTPSGAPILPASTFSITPRPLNATDKHCTYDVEADIYVPARTKVIVRNKSIAWAKCSNSLEPTLSLTITEPDDEGRQYLDCNITIPKWPEYTPGNWYVKDSNKADIGTATLTIDETGCYRYIAGTITLNTTTCEQTTSEPPAAPTITAVLEDVGTQVVVPNNGATNDTTPTIQGTATPNATVSVRANGVVLGNTTANAEGTWTYAVTTPLAMNTYAFTATAQNANGVSSASNSYSVYIYTENPAQFRTLPFSAAPGAPPNAHSIITPWDDETFVTGFITALKTNEKLKTAVKALLAE